MFSQDMECTPALDNLDKQLGCMCLRWSTTDEQDHDAVAGYELNNRTGLNAGEWCAVELFSAIRGVVHVVKGKYGNPLLSKPLPWPYHLFYVNIFYRNDLRKLGSTQNEE